MEELGSAMEFTSLEEIYLYQNRLTEIDVWPFLEVASLRGTKLIADVSHNPIQKFTKTIGLDLHNCSHFLGMQLDLKLKLEYKAVIHPM